MKVVVAVIRDNENRILLTQRSLQKTQGGRWEFPGGKIEKQELPEIALARELKEELDIIVHNPIFIGEVAYNYTEKNIKLMVYEVQQFDGQPTCLENQMDMRWVPENQLIGMDFPPANKGILSLLVSTA